MANYSKEPGATSRRTKPAGVEVPTAVKKEGARTVRENGRGGKARQIRRQLFDPVVAPTRVDYPLLEDGVQTWWDEHGVLQKYLHRNDSTPKRWSFIDGPITANNPMGVHHAWGRTYKDLWQRFNTMRGHELRYQNGFDCQGLWVEVEVEKQLKLRSKRDIENLVPGDRFASIDKFVQLCKERVDKYARVQTEQSIRLGYWMDWDREEDWSRPPDA